MRNFREVTERYRESNMETVILNGLYFPFVDLLSSVALAVVLGYGGHLYFQGAITLGTLFAFMLYVQNFFDPVQQLSQLYGTFLSATAALDKIVDVLDQEPEVLDQPGAARAAAGRGRRPFDDVRFGYGDGPEVLHGLDLEVPAGHDVALVGHTGAGSRRSPSCSPASTTRARGGSRSTGTTCATSPRRRCAASSGSSRRRGSSSRARSARTSPSAGPTRRRRTS